MDAESVRVKERKRIADKLRVYALRFEALDKKAIAATLEYVAYTIDRRRIASMSIIKIGTEVKVITDRLKGLKGKVGRIIDIVISGGKTTYVVMINDLNRSYRFRSGEIVKNA